MRRAPAEPQFIFELLDETVRLRLLARSQRDQSLWLWNGHEWMPNEPERRRQPANRKSWTTRAWSPRRNGCASWIGSRPSPACGSAMPTKASWARWPAPGPTGPRRPIISATRLFTGCSCRRANSGRGSWSRAAALIGWPSPPSGSRRGSSSAADLQRLASATGRFVKLPDSGWVELDTGAVQSAHEAMADLGVDGLVPWRSASAWSRPRIWTRKV